MSERVDFNKLQWETLKNIEVRGTYQIIFTCQSGNVFKMHHEQDCCESVYIEDICGDPKDLIGAVVLNAEQVTSSEHPEGVPKPDYDESFTWTFYKLDTTKGGITIRWYGESNGYYSESVDFIQIEKELDYESN